MTCIYFYQTDYQFELCPECLMNNKGSFFGICIYSNYNFHIIWVNKSKLLDVEIANQFSKLLILAYLPMSYFLGHNLMSLYVHNMTFETLNLLLMSTI